MNESDPNRRQEIIAAARRVFARHGFHKASIKQIAQEANLRHKSGYPERSVNGHNLPTSGEYQWRSEGELHLFSPQTIHALQKSTRSGDYALFKQYSKLINDQFSRMGTLRGLFEFKPGRQPVPIDEVESVEEQADDQTRGRRGA